MTLGDELDDEPGPPEVIECPPQFYITTGPYAGSLGFGPVPGALFGTPISLGFGDDAEGGLIPIYPVRLNLHPSAKVSALYRRKNDERVETRGSVCNILLQHGTSPGMTYDDFDERRVVGPEPEPLVSRCIIEPYQTPRDMLERKGQAAPDFPFIGTFKFNDCVAQGDLVEVPYEYARAAGLELPNVPLNPRKTAYTRFKLVNRRTKGINSDLILQFFLSPTEELWHA